MEVCRGDIFYVRSSEKTVGCEQYEGRPAVIVSNNKCNEFSDVVEVVFLTSKEKTNLPTHVKVMSKVPSTALCEQIKSVSKERLDNFVRTCTDEEMDAINRELMISLGIEGTEISLGSEEETKILNDHLKSALDKLAECEKQIEKLKSDNKSLEEFMLAESSKARNDDRTSNAIRAEAERDLYKNLYEQILEKMIKR